MLPYEIHEKPSEELQTIANQMSQVAEDILAACSPESQTYHIAGKFTCDLPCNPIYGLRNSLQSMVIQEWPHSDAGKLYIRDVPPGCQSPALLAGIPKDLAKKYNEIRDKRKMDPTGKEPGLNQVEILAISLFLKHCADMVIIITSYLERYYHHGHKVVIAADKALDEIDSLNRELIILFLDSLEVMT